MADRHIEVLIKMVAQNAHGVKTAFGDVEKEVKRINAETSRQAKQQQKILETVAKQTADNAIKEEKRVERERKQIANNFIASVKETANKSASVYSSVFKGSFLGSFAGTLTSSIVSQFAQIPGRLKDSLDEAMRIASERNNAFKGLESVSLFKGVDPNEAKAAVMNLRLVKAGVIDVGDGVTGLKNLLATGFSLPQANMLLERFSDSATFGKQSALSFGEAVKSATEGIKNGNSILVDNAGVTKNISVILKEAGFEMEDLSDKTKKHSALLALYNGLIVETQAQVGDADKLTRGWTGSTTALTMAKINLYAVMGDIITRNPALLALIQLTTGEINKQTLSLANHDSQSAKTFNNGVSRFASFALEAAILTKRMWALVKDLGGALALAVSALNFALQASISQVKMLINLGVIGPINTAIDGINTLVKGVKSLGLAAVMIPGALALQQVPELSKITPFNESLDGLNKSLLQTKFLWDNFAGEQRKVSKEADLLRENFRKLREENQNNPGIEPPPPKTDSRLNAGGGSDPTGARGRKAAAEHGLSSNARTIIARADQIGVSPLDYATFLLYEGAGSLSTSKFGGKGGKHLGPMQMGAWEQQHYGVKPGMSLDAYLGASNRYLTDRGVRPGASLLTLYKAINGGNVNVSENRADQNGTIAQHVQRMIRDRRPQAEKLLKGMSGGKGVDNEFARMAAEESDRLTKEAREKHLRFLLGLYRVSGMVPTPELVKQFQSLMVDDAKKTGAIQPNEGQVGAMFGPRGILSTDTAAPGSSLRLMPTLDEDYLSRFRESLKLDERKTDFVLRQRNLQDEIKILLEDQQVTQDETITNLEIEYRLLQKTSVTDMARLRAMQERNSLTRENKELEADIANIGKNAAERYQNAWLRAVYEVRDARIRANESIIASNVRLDDAQKIHGDEVHARVLDHLAQQKTQTELLADAFINAYDKAGQGLDKLLDKSGVGKIPILGDFIKGQARSQLSSLFRTGLTTIFGDTAIKDNPMMTEAQKQTAYLASIDKKIGGGGAPPSGPQNIFQRLLGGQGPEAGGTWGTISGNMPGYPIAMNATGGLNGDFFTGPAWQNILQTGGNTSGGVGSGRGSGESGGMLSQLFGGMFGPKPNLANGGKMSSMGGMMGGIGSLAMMAGGAVGGKWGNMISMAGMGMQIGSMFGPWGAAVGAGIGGGAGLLMALFGGGDGGIKKLKAAAASEFGIDVKDKSILNELKVIGEGYFGKGQVGAHAREVVRTEEASNILKAYAESSGQSSLKLDRRFYGDTDWQGNQFRGEFGGFRAMGGPVSAGMTYMVGERGREWFRPNVSGTIIPNQGGGAGDVLVLAQAVSEIAAELSRFRGISKGEILIAGIEEAPDAVPDAYERQLGKYHSRKENLMALTGQRG